MRLSKVDGSAIDELSKREQVKPDLWRGSRKAGEIVSRLQFARGSEREGIMQEPNPKLIGDVWVRSRQTNWRCGGGVVLSKTRMVTICVQQSW